MNADTGRIYDLAELGFGANGEPFWPPIGREVRASDLPTESDADARGLDEEAKAQLEELRQAVYDGEPIVTVSEDVAQQVRLGRRELDRRKRRRRNR